MKIHKLNQMTRGWFVGAFQPTAFHANEVEVGVKYYEAGDKETLHHHKIATEITLILNGTVQMCGAEYSSGDIIVLSPGEATDFAALSDVTTVVVKIPGALDDKYLGSSNA